MNPREFPLWIREIWFKNLCIWDILWVKVNKSESTWIEDARNVCLLCKISIRLVEFWDWDSLSFGVVRWMKRVEAGTKGKNGKRNNPISSGLTSLHFTLLPFSLYAFSCTRRVQNYTCTKLHVTNKQRDKEKTHEPKDTKYLQK